MIPFLPRPVSCLLPPGASPAGRVAGGAFLFEGLVNHVMLRGLRRGSPRQAWIVDRR